MVDDLDGDSAAFGAVEGAAKGAVEFGLGFGRPRHPRQAASPEGHRCPGSIFVSQSGLDVGHVHVAEVVDLFQIIVELGHFLAGEDLLYVTPDAERAPTPVNGVIQTEQ